MTRVLLITDTERVLRIFESLETKGSLQLRTAPTLTQGDLEISASIPDFTFVQIRISGFCGEIELRHLRKNLPKGAKIMLMAADADDAAQAKRDGRPFLDLSLDDEALTAAVSGALAGIRRASPKKAAKGRALPDGPRPDHADDLASAAPTLLKEQEKKEEPVAPEPPADAPVQETAKAVVEEPPADLPADGADKVGTDSFAEIMRRKTAPGGSPVSGLIDVEDRVSVGPLLSAAAEPSAPYTEEVTGPVPLNELLRGEPLAAAMLRAQKKKRPYWIFPLVLALISVPVVSYIAGRKEAPSQSLLASGKVSSPSPDRRPTKAATPAATPASATAKAPFATATPATKPAIPPAVPPVANPAAKQAALPVAPAPVAKPVAKAGIKTVPPFAAGARLDADYGKKHPGWQRYVDGKAEYKLYKEADLYKALQVIARGKETVSDQLFKKMLLEFGGIDSFRVESSVQKGDYLMERGVANGGVALTVYRKRNDLKMKALVLYYR